MELVYLWVEEYKNIEKQGFNFSPRFTCKYENNELIVIDKEETNEPYLKNFFGDNINITAIVGENGSGKSSILKSAISKERVFIIVFDEVLKIYTRNISINTSIEVEKLEDSFFKKVLYYSMDDIYLRRMTPSVNYIVLEETNKLITENYLKLNSLSFNIFDFKPAYIFYELSDFELIYEETYFDDNDTTIERIKLALGWDFSSDSGIIIDTLRALKDIGDEYLNYLLYQFGDIASLFENIDLTEKLHPKEGYLNIRKSEVQETLKNNKLPFVLENEFKSLIDNKNRKIKIEELESLFGKNYLELLFWKMQDEIEFNYFALNGASFNSLSHGEKTIYSFLVNLVNYNKNDFLFLLDEPDNTLHPDWQKKFLSELIYIINALGKKAHIVITTHSPFILSDLPKENVIFLEKDEATGNCINATNKININPFGANIHTLLSHGFFMKEGLMGEFAKEKINKVISRLNKKELSKDEIEYCENIISIIGEPILKRQLQKMLDSKRLSNVDEIDKIKLEINNLTKRLEELEK